MPYIDKNDRNILNPHIETLAEQIINLTKNKASDAAFAGLLNYSISTLAMSILNKQFKTLRYWQIAILTGVLHNVATEFYRMIAVPYEDIQKDNQGNIDEFVKCLDALNK